MQVSDSRDNPITTSKPEAVECFDRAVTAIFGFRQDTGDRLKQAFAADPNLAMGHCLRGYLMMLFGQRAMVPRAQRSLDAAREAAAAGVTPRERAHVAALASWVAGDLAGATARWDAIAAEHPRDLLALKLAQHGWFYAGDSERMRAVTARALPAWDEATPGYGFVLGCHAFALEETGDHATAERVGRSAITRNPTDIWAAHAVAHVFEMTGRPQEGIGWIERLEAGWSGCNNFAYHLFWHRCLFLLELGKLDRALDLYDSEVRSELTDDLHDIANAVSLLWRLEQEGVDVGDRWHELADRAHAHIDDHLMIFGDVHYLMALAAAGRAGDVARMVESLARFAAESSETQAAVAGEPGLALVDALLAHRLGEHEQVVAKIFPIRRAIKRIGGSRAQRELFDEMLLGSALSAGHFEQAKGLLAERFERRPRSAPVWRDRMQPHHRFGDFDIALAARAEAERPAAHA